MSDSDKVSIPIDVQKALTCKRLTGAQSVNYAAVGLSKRSSRALLRMLPHVVFMIDVRFRLKAQDATRLTANDHIIKMPSFLDMCSHPGFANVARLKNFINESSTTLPKKQFQQTRVCISQQTWTFLERKWKAAEHGGDTTANQLSPED